MSETPSSKTVSTQLGRITEVAKQMRGKALTTLAHHIDMDWMREAYRRTRKDGAARTAFVRVAVRMTRSMPCGDRA